MSRKVRTTRPADIRLRRQRRRRRRDRRVARRLTYISRLCDRFPRSIHSWEKLKVELNNVTIMCQGEEGRNDERDV
jgi:hypothetical protein